MLNKKHTLSKVTSYKTERTDILQCYLDANDNAGYQKALNQFKEKDSSASFRLTDMVVYESKNEDETIEVRVVVQAKGHRIKT